MKVKELYEKNKKRKICPIMKLKEDDVEINSKPIQKIKENLYKFLIGTAIILIILIIVFHYDMPTLGIAIRIICIFSISMYCY